MEAYRLEMTLEEDGMLVLHNLPLTAGETVEVIILVQPQPSSSTNKYPLHGLPITYIDPTEPIALEEICVRQRRHLRPIPPTSESNSPTPPA